VDFGGRNDDISRPFGPMGQARSKREERNVGLVADTKAPDDYFSLEGMNYFRI
jgi:hypothetical protein